MTNERVVVVAATSGIGQALCRALAEAGCDLLLVGRRPEVLEECAQDLRVRSGVSVATALFDARDATSTEKSVQEWDRAFPDGFTGLVACQGVLYDSEELDAEPSRSVEMIEVNLTSVVSVLAAAANQLASRGGGFVCGISSVAGDRGRAGNHLYGATKAALSTWLEGLRMRMHERGVRVLTVKPGVVDTRMARGRSAGPLRATPEQVAADVVRALRRQGGVLYTPWYWRFIMWVIRALPEPILRRLPI